jgi:6-phosphogluconolactonase
MNDTDFYLVASAQEPSGGIWRFRKNADGGCAEKAEFTRFAGANYLAVAPDGRNIYASGGDAERRGFVAAFRVGADGRLTPLNRLDTGGKVCCHLCVSPDGQRLYAANYWSGSVAGFTLRGDGALAATAEFDQHMGHGVDPARQEAPHPHFCGFTPDGNFLLVNDLGLDTIFAYPYSAARGIDTGSPRRTAILPEGSGPRHLLFEPEGTCLLVTEMGNFLQRLAYDGQGGFSRIAAASTLPENVNIPSKAAALRLSPDGRFVLVSNRGYDSIAVFDRLALKPVSFAAAGGKSPRDFAFTADGRQVIVTNEFTPNAVCFDFDAERGILTPSGTEWSDMPRPLCVLTV